MNALLCSDLHFTANARDAYRWGLFDWLSKLSRAHQVKHIFILGDLTDAKDYHSSRLVNRLADSTVRLHKETGAELWVLRANHDGLDPHVPYFHFLRYFPGIHYIATPFMKVFASRELLMLPHSRDPEHDWKQLMSVESAELVFMHQTVNGAIGENGRRLDGLPARVLTQMRGAKIWSGDVHVPQIIEGVEYVGAPYAVRFGDKFPPRVVVLENFRKQIDIENTWAPKRRFLIVTPAAKSIEGLDGLSEGDQVKVRIQLAPHEYVDWERLKRNAVEACAKGKLELCGLELVRVVEKAKPLQGLVRRSVPAQQSVQPEDRLRAYCAGHSIGAEVASVGSSLLKQALEH